MLNIKTTNQFEKDYKREKRAGRDLSKLKKVMALLAEENRLTANYKIHKLIGNYTGRMECHVEPDWLLIYKIIDQCIIFERTGSHSKLFR